MISKIYQNLLLRKPKIILSLIVLIAIFFGYQSKDFRLDASSETLLIEGDPDLKYLNEINEKWSIGDVAVAHRLGRLEIGDISLVVAVSAPHRGDAFLACQYSVDRIKQIVPIWKKEMFEDGEIWVGSDGEHYLSQTVNESSAT